MSMWSRLKSIAGGDRTNYTLAAATTVVVPDDSNLFYLTGTATVTALNAGGSTRNRVVTFVQSDSGATTLTNTNSADSPALMNAYWPAGCNPPMRTRSVAALPEGHLKRMPLAGAPSPGAVMPESSPLLVACRLDWNTAVSAVVFTVASTVAFARGMVQVP